MILALDYQYIMKVLMLRKRNGEIYGHNEGTLTNAPNKMDDV
jgi:hypothetical protein